MNTNKLLLFLLNLIIFLVILGAVYNMAYNKNKSTLNERENVYTRFRDINAQLDGFDEIQANVKENKTKMEDIFNIYDGYYKTNDEIISSYKKLITGILKQHEIQILDDTVKQEVDKADTSKMVLNLSFRTSYDQLYQLLFDIERFSTIIELNVSYLGDITVKCSPNLYSKEINDFFSGRIEQSLGDVESIGYFKSISDTLISDTDIGYYSTWKDLFPVPKNPMFPGYTKKKAVVKKKYIPVAVDKPLPTDIVLEGVMYEKNAPIAIIDGKLLKVGSIHKGARLIKINKNNVEFEYYGKLYKVRMEN